MKKKLHIILVILWMIFIFYMSSNTSTESSKQSGVIVSFIIDLFNITNTDNLTFIIRKLAHFIEYFILGILVINVILDYHKRIYYAITICFIYALSDELHQIFIPGRSCEVRDIIIDIIGSVMGIYFLYFLKKKHIRQTKISKFSNQVQH